MECSGWLHHCQVASLQGAGDQIVGMVTGDHRGSNLWLQSWEEHDLQLEDNHGQEVVG